MSEKIFNCVDLAQSVDINDVPAENKIFRIALAPCQSGNASSSTGNRPTTTLYGKPVKK